MAHAMLLAWSSPVSADREAEFNGWYTGTHIPQIRAAIPGVTAVHRYRVHGGAADGRPTRYLCCYELGSTDAATAAKALSQARQTGAFSPSESMDVTTAPPVLEFVESTGELD